MSKKILVINGNPKSSSFCQELAEQYIDAIQEAHEVRLVSLSTLEFELDLRTGYDMKQPLEPDLVDFQAKVKWAEHIVFILPVWWGGMPAKLKGLIDRTFLPNFAFKYQKNKSVPEKLLRGRTADVVLTMDTPPFYYRWFQGDPVYKQMKRTLLEFCGVKVVSKTYIGSVISSSKQQRAKWVKRLSRLAGEL